MSCITVTKPFYGVLLLLAVLVAATAIAVPKTSRAMTKNFETVHPQILKKSRHARDVHPENIDIQIASGSGDSFTLRLTLNNELIAPQFASVYFEEDGKEVKITGQAKCFYHGEVLEHPEWKVAMDSCQGLRGSFGNWSNSTQQFHIEPLDQDDASLEQPHALYQVDESEEDGSCGTTHDHYVDSSNPLELEDEELDRARRQSPTGAHIVEISIVSDSRQYTHFQRDLSRTVTRAIAVANAADRIYRELNVRIVVVHSLVWTNGDQSQFSGSPDTTLQTFRTYAQSLFSQASIDAVMLLTGNDFNGNTVGIAYLNTMCGSASVGVVQDRHSTAVKTGSTFAHEIGHLLSLRHDESSCSCNDPSGRCVMAAVSGTPAPESWSSCSRSTLRTALATHVGRCLNNEPTSTVADPVCGNGIREGNEICDCGSAEECDDPCCDARTCRLAAGAQCTRGECCSNTCRFLASDRVCRASSGECDLAETCTGRSSDCPADISLQDGSSCNNNRAYCYSGECKTYNDQCQTHFGTNKGVDECFSSYNTEGNYFGNCGSDGTNFIGCSSSDVMCGQLFCQRGTFLNTINSVYILEVGVYVPSTRSVEQCHAFTLPPTADTISPGLVDDGVKCGGGKMCYEQRCRSISSLGIAQCPTGSNGRVCSGNGVCNSRGRCTCNSGYSGRTCSSAGSVNECLNNNGGCAHTCVDTSTSYRCTCRRGFTLGSDGRSCTPVPTTAPTTPPTTPPAPTACGGRLTTASGSFQTPGWPNSYPQENFQCEWIIDVPVAGYGIQFTIDPSAYGINGRPPCSNDYIQFFDGTGASANSLSKLCRYENPAAITTSSSEARVVFAGTVASSRPAKRVGVRVTYTITDIDECTAGSHNCQQICQNTAGSFTCSCNSGFTLDSNGRTCTANPTPPPLLPTTGTCGGRLTGGSGSFQTQGYPNGYPQEDIQCVWTVEVPSGARNIRFTIEDSEFGIKGRSPCTTDHIEFFNGTGSNARSLAKVCGLARFYPNNSLPTVTTTSRRAKVVFTATENRNRPRSRVGVKVHYEAVY